MRKLLLSAFIIASSVISAAAQCVPDTSIHDNGIFPDTVTGLPHATIGQTYATTIQFRVIHDTTFSGLPATVDSVMITGVSGIPAGFSYSCTPLSCSFPGGSVGCIYLFSNGPVAGTPGVNPIVVNMTAYGHVVILGALNLPQQVTGYNITIDNGSGIPGVNLPSRLSVSEFTPNPVTPASKIVIGVPQPGNVRIETFDLLGNSVRTDNFDASTGWNNYQIPVESLSAGVYLTRVSFGKDVVTRRMVVSSR